MTTKAMAARERRRRPKLALGGDENGEQDRDEVFRVLLEQHSRLRALLGDVDGRAVAVLNAKTQPGPALQSALENVVQALTDHMGGEERALTTLLPRTRASGRELLFLRAEHTRQRAELEAMRRRAVTADDALSLALAARAFVADVLMDMDFEEKRYLSSGARTSDRT
jgi:hypothetical protein